jgi:hypothetical protein
MCVLNVLSLSFLVTNGHENLVSQGIVPFDSHYYKYLGRCARIPGVECDTIKMDTTGRHVVILKNGRYFKLEVLDKKGRIASPRQLKERLQYILNLAGDEEDERYIAALTAQERTTWAKQRNILEQDEDNKATLEAIDSALFVVSMENSNPADHQDYCRRTFHGSGRNVWFDKCFTMLIFPNGYYSNNVEHSALDATVSGADLTGAVSVACLTGGVSVACLTGGVSVACLTGGVSVACLTGGVSVACLTGGVSVACLTGAVSVTCLTGG